MIWAPIPLAVVWTIWNTRNKKVLENKPVDWAEVNELIVARVGFWVSTSKAGSKLCMDDIIFRLNSVINQ